MQMEAGRIALIYMFVFFFTSVVKLQQPAGTCRLEENLLHKHTPRLMTEADFLCFSQDLIRTLAARAFLLFFLIFS